MAGVKCPECQWPLIVSPCPCRLRRLLAVLRLMTDYEIAMVRGAIDSIAVDRRQLDAEPPVGRYGRRGRGAAK